MVEQYLTTKSKDATSDFEYSVENPPPLEVLSSHLIGVHATDTLPQNGILKAGLGNTTYKSKGGDPEAPSFRPTLHFSLDALVPEHGAGSWEEKRYAILAPLPTLLPQLVNLFPHDTFVMGDLPLQPGMTVIVPEQTNTSMLPAGVEIVTYQTVESLRQVVDRVVATKTTWQVHMKPGGVGLGSYAYIDGQDINDARFFASLCEAYPEVSYGTHIESERGNAFRFGVIDQLTQQATKSYNEFGREQSTTHLQFLKETILHHLEKLENSLKQSQLPESALRNFEEKKEKLRGWMNIIERDLELRQNLGKTLSRLPDSLFSQVLSYRDNVQRLRKYTVEIYTQLKDSSEDSGTLPATYSIFFNGMSVAELDEFVMTNNELMGAFPIYEFYAQYAHNRWLTIRTHAAYDEHLDALLVHSLDQVEQWSSNQSLFSSLSEFVDTNSNRLEEVLTILSLPAVQTHLTRYEGMDFSAGTPQSFQDILHAHPATRTLFENQVSELTQPEQQAEELLKRLDLASQSESDWRELTTFSAVRHAAVIKQFTRSIKDKYIQDLLQPLHTARNSEDLSPGTTLTAYENLRQRNSATQLWRSLGLESAYHQHFSSDAEFWQSDKSLVEIYQELST